MQGLDDELWEALESIPEQSCEDPELCRPAIFRTLDALFQYDDMIERPGRMNLYDNGLSTAKAVTPDVVCAVRTRAGIIERSTD